MLSTLLGKKIGMSQLWDDDGKCHPVTVIQAGPCTVVQVKSKDGKDGYDAVQLGFDELQNRNGGQGDPRGTKPLVGHYKRHGVQPHRRRRPGGDRALPYRMEGAAGCSNGPSSWWGSSSPLPALTAASIGSGPLAPLRRSR